MPTVDVSPPLSTPRYAAAGASSAPIPDSVIAQEPSLDLLPARTVWGLDAPQLHNRYWAAHGVQVVAQGEPSEIVRHAELYLLCDPGTLALFQLAPLMEALNWIKPQVLFVRLHDARDRGYRENVVLDASERFVRFQRSYDSSSRLARVALTPDREIALLWQSAIDPIRGWRRLRRFIPRHDRATRSAEGSVYSRTNSREIAHFVQDLVQIWKRPDSTVLRAKKAPGEVWTDAEAQLEPGAKFIGPVWVGAGRTVSAAQTVIGPAVIWDDPMARPTSDAIEWLNIQPTTPDPPEENLSPRGGLFGRAAKRLFDIAFAICAILGSLPLYPLIMLAIWIEDGRPFFFAHRRETVGGREFPCVKFRSMRKDAEKMKATLKSKNQADGPQFFIENDPRLTRIGRLLRKYNLDELPQFFNVLVGDMSVVGPRPSPRHENQYCPPWREARLSVRPGITGLWQVKRTRRTGTDFQEWIKFDIEYVERRSFWLDMKIIFQTVSAMSGKISRS
ncbi:MAG TPA: sugar transferase [Tepidisphaeraceae bacterium]|jgi:lipopolysaccharide/colanic/teichoic acid biosynthesis glycosyltransferase|nr:sugar transferase [Tepidisphaeraceae bacterium]